MIRHIISIYLMKKNETYSFCYKEEDRGIKYKNIDVKTATIYENNNETPHIIQYTYYKKNTMNKVLRDILAFGFGESSKKRYEIVISEGTILKMNK